MTTIQTSAKRIQNVRVLRMVDVDPDTSWIGEYASSPGPDDRTIDREERGDRERGEYRYFVAAMSGDETGNPASVEADYQRMESMNRGNWGFIGIRAEARIVVDGVCQTITSAGLWGIESDSGADYFREVAAEELSQLRQQLLALGFTARQLSAVFKEAATGELVDA